MKLSIIYSIIGYIGMIMQIVGIILSVTNYSELGLKLIFAAFPSLIIGTIMTFFSLNKEMENEIKYRNLQVQK